jgi:hypothetical protein
MFRITREHRWRVFGRARALGLAFAGFALSSCNQVASLQATCKLVIDLDQGSVPSIEQSLQAFADRRHFAVAFMGKMPVPGTDAVGIGRPIIRAFSTRGSSRRNMLYYSTDFRTPKRLMR